MPKKRNVEKDKPRPKTTKMCSPGAPSDYTLENAKRICDAVATSPFGLKGICKKNPDFPNPQTIYAWLARYPEFAKMYEQAKEHQCNAMAEEILDVSYDSSHDTTTNKIGEEIMNTEFIARSRLKVDSLKWLLTKLQPRKYGDRTESHVTVTTQEVALRELKKGNDVS